MARAPLISAADLAALLPAGGTSGARADVLVLDVRFQLGQPGAGALAYAQGHIPGAIHAHLEHDLSGPRTGRNGRHPLPAPAAWNDTLGRWGVRPDTEVIAYDDAQGMFAARAWWMLRWMGHERVRVLDGGWPRWLAQGGAISTQAEHRPRSAVDRRARHELQASLEDVLRELRHGAAMQLIDARAPDRFRGENETLDPVGGHIPGALNRFFQLNLAPQGGFKSAQALRQEFAALLDGRPASAVVHQCGSGVTACHNLLAMELAGLGGSRLYAGSWSEWCADPARAHLRSVGEQLAP